MFLLNISKPEFSRIEVIKAYSLLLGNLHAHLTSDNLLWRKSHSPALPHLPPGHSAHFLVLRGLHLSSLCLLCVSRFQECSCPLDRMHGCALAHCLLLALSLGILNCEKTKQHASGVFSLPCSNHLYCCSLLLIASLTFPWKVPRAAELDKLVPFLTNKKTIDILAVLNSLTVLARSPAFTEAASWACDCRLGKIKTDPN